MLSLMWYRCLRNIPRTQTKPFFKFNRQPGSAFAFAGLPQLSGKQIASNSDRPKMEKQQPSFRWLFRRKRPVLTISLMLGLLVNSCLAGPMVASQQQQQPTPASAPVAAQTNCCGSGSHTSVPAIAAQSAAPASAMQSVLVQPTSFASSQTASEIFEPPSVSKSVSSTLQVGGGEGGGEGGGGGDPCAGYVNRVVAVTGTNDHTVKIEYELSVNYPTAGCTGNNGGYYQLYRRCDAGVSSQGYHFDGQHLTDWACGPHELTVDLECLAGEYVIVFVPEDPNCSTVFGGAFTFEDGAATFLPNDPWQVAADFHAGPGELCSTGMTCNACGCQSTLDPHDPGDSATQETSEQTNGANLQVESAGGGSCGGCGDGSAGAGDMPFIPFGFWMNNHLAAHPTSLGAGVHTPFDYSVHAWNNYVDNKLRIRMTDPGSARVVNFVATVAGGTTCYDDLDLFRDAKLIGGGTLEDATHIDVTRHNGEVLRFALFETTLDPDKKLDRDGRLTSWKTVGNVGYDFTYSDGISRKINVMTDAFGREYDFSYSGTHGGRPSVSSVAMPNGATITFGYADHVLSNVSVISGATPVWQWTNTKSDDGAFTKMVINHPDRGQRVYRFDAGYLWSKSSQMANPISALSSIRDSADAVDILRVQVDTADPQLVILKHGVSATNGDMSVLYQQGIKSHPGSHTIYDPDLSGPTVDNSGMYGGDHHRNVWSGGIIETNLRRPENIKPVAKLARSFGGGVLPNESLGNFVNVSAPLSTAPTASFQSGPPLNEWLNGAPPKRISRAGEEILLEYDADLFLTKRTWPDATIEEFTRDTDKRITRYRDRLGNVTLYTYNSSGKVTQRQVGLKVVGGSDQQQPEYAAYNFTRSGVLLVTEFSPLSSGQSDIYRTDYEYETAAPNIGRLKKIIHPADEVSGTRGETLFNWNGLGQLQSTTDPVGRVTSFTYDAIGRTIMIIYHDGSSEQTLYNSGVLAGQVQATRDRNSVVTTYSYDLRSRMIGSVVGAAIDANLFDGLPHDTIVTDPNEISTFARTFFTDTDILKSETRDGRTTKFVRDGMNRVRETRQHPNSSTVITSKTGYAFYQTRYNQDWMGRATFNAYNSAGDLVRTIVEAFPGSTGLNPLTVTNAQILAKTRDFNSNAPFLITDRTYDAESQMLTSVDERAITSSMEYDSRGRTIRQIAAVGTSVESKTETDYDAASNVIEVRSPRYFISSDAGGYQTARTTYEYNGRELQSSVFVHLNSSQVAETQTAYGLDGRVSYRLDPRSNQWDTDWHACCGRLQGSRDPANNGSITNNDYRGSVTHTARVANYDSQTDYHNPINGDTLSETTIRIDALRRQRYSTNWLVPRGYVDPNNVPIAGIDADNSGTIDAPLADGLTQMVFFDVNLTDGMGLDSTSGMAIPDMGTTSTINVSISGLISQLTTATGISFASGSAGSAVLTVNAEEEFSVSISDGMGRTVMVARAEPDSQSANLQAVTWSYSIYDNTFDIGSGGIVKLVSESRSMDALGNIVRGRTDGAGRTLQTVDALGNVSTASFDAGSNLVAARDPNLVGFDAVYDELGRMTSRTDTYGITTSAVYDRGGNVVTSVDGKSNSTASVYDAAGRRVSVTDRLSGVTQFTFDVASNLLSVVDPETQTTSYTYNSRGLRESETYPDHTGGLPGDASYGQRWFEYDGAGRLLHIQDQADTWMTLVYDMASRITAREYRTGGSTGTPIDSDAFGHDRASRMTSAISGRYNNTVSMDYDSIGRLNSESLAIAGQTYVTGYALDARNQLFQLTYPSGTVAERTYTARGQLHTNKFGSNVEDTRAYDAGGRLLSSAYRNGVTTTRSYRNNANGKDNMLAGIAFTHPAGTATNRKVGDLAYTWEANRNKTAESITGTMSGYSFDTTLGTDPDGYDDEDRLTYFKRTNNANPQTWNLSLVGDWNSWSDFGTAQTRTHGPTHEVTVVGGSAVTHNVKGNITFIPVSVSTPARNLYWDFDNRLPGVDNTGDNVADVTFEYDALGRRVSRSAGTDNVVYVHAGQQVIADYPRGAAPGTAPIYRYLWGDYIDELVTRVNATGGNAYYHHNQQFSTIAITHSNGLVVSRMAYTANGTMAILSYSGTTQPWSTHKTRYTWTGREWDSDTGLYHFRARTYEPKLGRFLGRDPLGFVDGMSLYRGYMALQFVDWSGKEITCDCPMDDEFKAYGLRFTRNGNGPYTYSFVGWDEPFDPNSDRSMRALILARMLMSPTNFSIAGMTHEEEVKNMKTHLRTRINIVKNASKTVFKFTEDAGNVLKHHEFDPAPDKTVEPERFFQSINNEQTIIQCREATQCVFFAATGKWRGNWKQRNHQDVWIPGDWGFVINSKYEGNETNWPQGTEGENIIHVGVDKDGNELYWGHGVSHSDEKSIYFNAVNDFVGINGEKGNAILGPNVNYPSAGLDP